MTVHDLIMKLLLLPQDAEVVKSNTDGCPECNPECMEAYHDIRLLEYYQPGRAPYPNHDIKKKLVVL